MMSYTKSLQKSRDFSLVYRTGRSKANTLLVLYKKKNGTMENRVGISVSKKVGNSVVRHRIKRLIKEIYRLRESSFRRGYDLVWIARAPAVGKSFREMEDAVMSLSSSMNLLEEEEPACREEKEIQ